MKMAPLPDQQRQEPVASSSSDKTSSVEDSSAVAAAAVTATATASNNNADAADAAAAAAATTTASSESSSSSSASSTSSSSSASSSSSSSSSSSTTVVPEANSGGSQQQQSAEEEIALPSLNNAAVVEGKKVSKEGTTDLLELDENELRKLLEEAVEYRSPKDRAGKSEHFQELLTSVEAEEQKNLLFFASGAGGSSSSGSSGARYRASYNYSSSSYNYGSGGGSGGSNNGRRSHGSRRDSTASVAEHLTHGGSLQNLAQESCAIGAGGGGGGSAGHYSYSASSGSYYNGKRRQTRKGHPGPSVSARQREGGSLPSNVDATHTLVGPSLANFQLAFEQKKGLSEEKSVHNWFNNKEKSKSLDKPSYSKREDKEKDKKDNKLSGSCDIESESRDKRSSSRGKLGTNEMLESDNSPPEYKDKPDCMVISVDDLEASGVSEQNASAALGGVQQQQQHHQQQQQQQQHLQSSGSRSLDADDDEGTEMKVIDNSSRAQFITHASLTVSQAAAAAGQNQVDSGINFSTLEKPSSNNNNSSSSSNLNDNKIELPFPPYNGKLMSIGAPDSPLSLLSWTSIFGSTNVAKKEPSSEKALDVNGNSVQGSNGPKKHRRKNTQEANCITYPAQKVPGHRDDSNIDSLVNFIENKESRGKKGGSGGGGGKASSGGGGGGGGGGSSNNNSLKTKAAQAGAKASSRSARDNKDAAGKREQVSGKLHKSNSLEEISKTKLEDLTAKSGAASSGSSSVSSNNDSVNVVLRRSKQRSTGDTQAVELRGERRSWETSQSINYNDIGADYGSLNSIVKNESETEFHVVTSKKTKKTKKQPQGRSSSGSRAQHLKASDLHGGREFSSNYRMPLSPELTRKLASSVAASEKSDSSDGESNHSNRSLPATSKLGSFKTTPSGEIASDTAETIASSSMNSAMQVSYAGAVTRNKPDALDKSMPMLSQLHYVQSVNLSGWPNVSSKSASSASSSSTEQTADKLQNDHYPPLQESQKSARQQQQHHSSAQQPQATSSQNTVDKPSSPTTVPKSAKASPESSGKKSTESAQDEAAIIKVHKYVQDIENMQQQQQQQQQSQQQESKQQSSGNNSSPITSEAAPLHPLPPRSPESLPAYSSSSSEVESSSGNNESSSSSCKDSKNTTVRIRRQVHPSQMPGATARDFSAFSQGQQQQSSHVASDDSKKISSSQLEESAKSSASSPSVSQQEDKDVKSAHSAMTAGPSEADVQPRRFINTTKMVYQSQVMVAPWDIRFNKVADRYQKPIKDSQPIVSKDSTMFYPSQPSNNRQDKPVEDYESKKSKQSPPLVNSEKKQELPRVQMAKPNTPTAAAVVANAVANLAVNATANAAANAAPNAANAAVAASSRPAVILLDENAAEQNRSVEPESSELTFGFEINQELLKSAGGSQIPPTVVPELARFSNSPPSRAHPYPQQQPPQQMSPPAAFENQQQYQPQPQQQQQPIPPPLQQQIPQQHQQQIRVRGYPVNAYMPVHQIPPHSAVMVQAMFVNCPVSMQGAYPVMPQMQPLPVAVVEKRSKPKEDFSSRYIAPDESHVQNFNHDKIVTFVGTSWKEVFQEMANSIGRVHYYSDIDRLHEQ